MFLFFSFVVLGVVFTRLLCHFAVILVSVGVFWRPWAHRAPLKGPRQKSDEKVGSLVAFWHPQRVPLGTFFGIFRVFSEFFVVCFSKSFLEGFWGLWAPPPTMRIMVSFKRNHCFHFSTWSSKTTENGVPWMPFGTPLGGFGGCWEPFWGMRK